MAKYVPKWMSWVVVMTTIVGMLACVSSKKYEQVSQDKTRLEGALNLSHRELREFRELRLTLEDQLRAKTNDAEALQKKVVDLQKQREAAEVQNQSLREQNQVTNEKALKLRSDLDSAKANHIALVSLLNEQIAMLKTKKRSVRRKRK
jgi:chromosome segregation ATPase